jgi:sialate O-acetylesterase
MPDTILIREKEFGKFRRGPQFKRRTLVCLLSLLGICAPSLWADPVLPHLFSEHMVLQRETAVPIWGWGDPDEKISVSLAGKTLEAVTADDGRWKVSFPPMRAGGPFTLTVRGKKTIVIRDVSFGEVWVASGQSNMTYALSGATGGETEIPKAVNPLLRFFTVPKKISLTAQSDTLPATWEVCSPDTAKNFSAVGYFFARDLYNALHVPIGIILSAWPGTSGEEWTPPEELRRESALRPIAERWETSPADVKSYAAGPTEFWLEFDDFELLSGTSDSPVATTFSNFDDRTPQTATGGAWTYRWEDAPNSAFDLVAPGRGGSGYTARVSGALDGTNFAALQANFHSDGTPADLNAFSGIRFWARGKGIFQFQMLQPSISDWDDYSIDPIHANDQWKQVTVWFKDLKQAGWGVSKPFTPASLTAIRIVDMTEAGDPDRPPSGLYEGMITPLHSYRIRGAIWYQGEGNTWRAHQYRTLLPALITGWRENWKQGNFPFLIVQLPNQGSSPELGDSIWAELRDAQLQTLKNVPNAGLAVTIDVGEEKNLHPPRKAEVGARLALWALGTTYGKPIVYSGPLYDSMKIEENQIRIDFTHTGSGLSANGSKLKGFAVAGADRKFHWADATISGDTVVVSSAAVANPVAARYAWANSPECNLYNKEGLPASPFRTDDWPEASANQK